MRPGRSRDQVAAFRSVRPFRERRIPSGDRFLAMLEVGDRVPEARVWTTPQERATIQEIASDGAMLLLFYLFDWSST